MEPGDLRINSRLRDDSGVPKNSPNSAYGASNEANSVLHFRNHVRPAVITDGRLHHIQSPMMGAPLMVDRREPVKIWRDPSLINSSEIRHVVSMQHSGVVHLTHPMVAHSAHSAAVNTSGNVYQQHHHDNKSLDVTSRGPQPPSDGLRGRAPVVFPPHTSAAKLPMEAWRSGPGPGVLQNPKDVRVSLTGKSTVEQAVHDHFVESLRLAQLKGSSVQPVKQEERPNPHSGGLPRYYAPPQEKPRHHEMPPQPVMYQIHQQHQAMNKPELPAPPPLRSEPQYRTAMNMDSSRKHQIYGAPEIMGRPHEGAQQQSSIRYEPEPMQRLDVLPSENCVRYQKLPPAASASRRPATQSDLQQLERNRSPYGKPGTPAASPNSYPVYPQSHMAKHKVSSPAPPHIYGKPGAASRPYEMGGDPSPGPLPLTSKGGMTRPSQSSPQSYSHPHSHPSPSLPQHDVRKADVAYYMYQNGPPNFQPSLSPQAHHHTIQTQPLDLGGKRKMEEEVYKGSMQEYSDPKLMYGSRKPDDSNLRHKMPHNHISNPGPLSLTMSEPAPKRKMEDVVLPMHLDTKKVKSEVGPMGGANLMGRGDYEPKPSMSHPHYYPPEGHLHHHHQQQHQQHHQHHPHHHLHQHHHRMQALDNPTPMSLIVSESVTKVKTEVRQTPPPEVSRPDVKIGAVETKPVVSPVEPVALCNGKHRDVLVESKTVITPVEVKPEPMEVPKVKSEPTPPPPPTPSSSASTASSSSLASSSSFSSISKFQKVPKKAWVLQWHEGDNTQSKSSETNTGPQASVGNEGTNANSSSSNGSSSSAQSGAAASADKNSTDENGKLVNGHIPGNTSTENESKPVTTTASNVTLNGFGKERLNESDIGSENESDNSGKDKILTDSSTPTKKNGRKGKECGQASPKPDLRKDGLCKRPPVGQLKKTGESFIQAETCNRVTPKIGKCRECRWHPSGRGSKKQSGAYCRFYGFRKLRYTKGGSLTVAGFSDPFTDPSKITEHDQFCLWQPSKEVAPGLDAEMSKFLLTQLCDQFCDLVQREEEARVVARTQESSEIAWKPLLKGVREMCDVCDTTLFNFHWACGKCGFVVCLDCFKHRSSETEGEKVTENTGKDRDEFQWLLCSSRSAHELENLMLVQTIAGDALLELNKKLHTACSQFEVSQSCGCKTVVTPTKKENEEKSSIEKSDSDGQGNQQKDGDTEAKETDNSAKSVSNSDDATASQGVINKAAKGSETANGCKTSSDTGTTGLDGESLKHFKRASTSDKLKMAKRSDKMLTPSESSHRYPDVKHSWLCNDKVLRLLDPENPDNLKIFHDQWKSGQPVIASNVTEKLDKTLWTPDSFAKDFGDYKNDLVNCTTGKVVVNQPMRKFWEGFSCESKRLKDENGETMILKLKDWPPSDDFAQLLPSRFQDLMPILPLPEYSKRDGKINLAARLPADFMKPDLGPKLYVAYGSALGSEEGTTNLHLDVSDAVNVLVHCEAPQETESDEHDKAVMKAIEESDCDLVTINRVVIQKEVPGALWHVYEAKDADKIRDLLNKVAIENGSQPEPHHDAIYAQSCYLDKSLRNRLRTEYNVQGYSILQCAGDAIFIPAGAPHQVRNLQNCIKVSEDFVSPENISHSFSLTEEFRLIGKEQGSFEDKLQIKNIVYHAVKDAISVLLLQTEEKSDSTTKDNQDASTTALSKDCQFQPSTSSSSRDPAAVAGNSSPI